MGKLIGRRPWRRRRAPWGDRAAANHPQAAAAMPRPSTVSPRLSLRPAGGVAPPRRGLAGHPGHATPPAPWRPPPQPLCRRRRR
ncbi:hypothetical protein E2C01_049513 [Portunus trituberculatus]|uniref:Uncharacterized protein n=1 Tax=Portunus trituberculatus TaxID=210409 RepID=A0A5B7G6K6_PORTR|nr:hypothetical protein [Portunus trituberculatus]